jgi:hypothetical protein
MRCRDCEFELPDDFPLVATVDATTARVEVALCAPCARADEARVTGRTVEARTGVMTP